MPGAGNECTVDARRCDAAEPVTTLLCQTGADGCAHSVDVAACAESQACWLGECRCEGTDCIRLDSIFPAGPYFPGDVLVLTGRNFHSKRGGLSLKVNGVETNVITSQSAPDADTRVEYRLAATGKSVRVQVANSVSSDWRFIEVHPLTVAGGDVDVNLISSTPSIPLADQSVELRFLLYSRALDTTLTLASSVPVLDLNRQPLPSVKLAAGAELEVIVYVPRLPARRTSVVLTVTGPEVVGSSGLVWLEPNLPT